MANSRIGFRGWYYLRTGWSTYFAFIFAAINTLVVTYYLAIERVPSLEIIFPNFLSYLLVFIIIGTPLLILTGYLHFQRSHAYGSEAEIAAEKNPYFYKAAPGWVRDVQWPLFLKFSELLLKQSTNEKLNEQDLAEIAELQKKIKKLINGESIGSPREQQRF